MLMVQVLNVIYSNLTGDFMPVKEVCDPLRDGSWHGNHGEFGAKDF